MSAEGRYISRMVPIEHLGRALAILREKHRSTQEDVARTAGITSSMISNYEREKEKPSLDSLWKILGAMNCTLIDLEAALRFARGDSFPVRSQHWKIRIDDGYETGGRSRQPGFIDEPVDLTSMLPEGSRLSVEAQQWLGVLMQASVGLAQLSDPQKP